MTSDSERFPDFTKSSEEPTFDGIIFNWVKHWEPGQRLHITFKKRHLRHIQGELPDLRRFFPEATFNLSSNEQGKPILTITSDTPPVANLESFRG